MSSFDRAAILERIAELQDAGDVLASEFKACLRQAREAYEDEDHELAKELSARGRELRAQCEDVNAEANRLRGLLGMKRVPPADVATVRRPDLVARDAPSPNATVGHEHRREPFATIATTACATPFAGWPPRLDHLRRALQSSLATRLPRTHVAAVRSVSFIDEVKRIDEGRIKGGTCSANGDIVVYGWPVAADEQASVERAFFHEVGHAVLNENRELLDRWLALLQMNLTFHDSLRSRYRRAGWKQLAREAFADAYMNHVVDSLTQAVRDPVAFAFMSDDVFAAHNT